MSMAQVLIMSVVREGRSLSEVARDYGVSRRWLQKLLRRYESEGEAGFEPRSRRPHTSPRRTPTVVEELVVAQRKELTDRGLDAGAETIGWHLRQRTGSAPSTAIRLSEERPAGKRRCAKCGRTGTGRTMTSNATAPTPKGRPSRCSNPRASAQGRRL
jgi:transposase-like protein